MNRILTFLVLLALPLMLVAGKPETKLNQQTPSTKTAIDTKAKQTLTKDTRVLLKGPSISSGSYVMMTSAGPLASLQPAVGESVKLQAMVRMPFVDVTPMSPMRDAVEDSKTLDEDVFVITEYALHQNYPNPFNPSTSIAFDLVEAGHTRIVVYNSLGQTMATLIDGEMPAGQHTLSFNAESLPSGLYFYRMEAGDFHTVKKMILMK